MTKLEELQKEIRSKIPRLMEVERGVKGLSKHYGMVTIINYTEVHEGIFDLYCFDDEQGLPRTLTSPSDVEIIGHPIVLSDVLEWLGLIENKEVFYSSEGFFGYIHYDKWYELINCEWKGDNLKYQNIELIDYLHSLV